MRSKVDLVVDRQTNAIGSQVTEVKTYIYSFKVNLFYILVIIFMYSFIFKTGNYNLQ